jgi:hypothetical protein
MPTAKHVSLLTPGWYVTPDWQLLHSRSDVVVGAAVCRLPASQSRTAVHRPALLLVLNDWPSLQVWQRRSEDGVGSATTAVPAGHVRTVLHDVRPTWSLYSVTPLHVPHSRSVLGVGAVFWYSLF